MRSIKRLFKNIIIFFTETNNALREINKKGMGPK
jgi:hypothetical protein